MNELTDAHEHDHAYDYDYGLPDRLIYRLQIRRSTQRGARNRNRTRSRSRARPLIR